MLRSAFITKILEQPADVGLEDVLILPHTLHQVPDACMNALEQGRLSVADHCVPVLMAAMKGATAGK